MVARRFGTSPLVFNSMSHESSLARYRVEHSKKNSISPRGYVFFISSKRERGGSVEGIEGTPHASFPFCIKDDAVKNYVKVVYPTGTSITTGKMRTQTEEPCI